MLIPGSPVIRTGRVRRRNTRSAATDATTGPVQASRTTSGRSIRSRAISDAYGSTSTGSPAAARICAADGRIGLSITTWLVRQRAGIARSVAALHFRYESESATASTRG